MRSIPPQTQTIPALSHTCTAAQRSCTYKHSQAQIPRCRRHKQNADNTRGCYQELEELAKEGGANDESIAEAKGKPAEPEDVEAEARKALWGSVPLPLMWASLAVLIMVPDHRVW